MAVRPLPSPRSRPLQPTVVELTSTNIAVAVAGLATLVAYCMLILVPAWTSYGRLWERVAASVLTLFMLATLLGIGSGIGLLLVWSYDRYA
jgi:hypothetical protein